jgi:hypothetical protein
MLSYKFLLIGSSKNCESRDTCKGADEKIQGTKQPRVKIGEICEGTDVKIGDEILAERRLRLLLYTRRRPHQQPHKLRDQAHYFGMSCSTI